MGVFDIFRKDRVATEVKNNPVKKDVAIMNLGNPIWTDRNADAIAKAAYELNSVSNFAIRKIARSAAAITLVPKKINTRTGEYEELPENHRLIKLFRRPNAKQGQKKFFQEMYSQQILYGNSYTYAYTSQERGDGTSKAAALVPNGDIMRMYNLRPSRMKVVLSEAGDVGMFQHTVDGKNKWFGTNGTRSSIFHYKEYTPLDDFYGMSLVEPALWDIDIYNKASEFNKSLLDNGAKLTMAIMLEEAVSDEERENILRGFKRMFQGAGNAGGVAMLEGGASVKELGLSPRDIEFNEATLKCARTICSVLGVPPFMLGLPGDNTFNNMKEARLDFYESTVLPLIDFVCDELSNYINGFTDEEIVICYDEDTIPALQPKRDEYIDRINGTTFLTLNEKRQAAGYDTFDDPMADQIWIEASKVPLSFSAAMPEDMPPAEERSLDVDYEYKLFNDRTEAARKREIAIVNRLMDATERPMMKSVELEIDRQAREAADIVKTGSQQIEDIMFKGEQRMLSLYNAHVRKTFDIFGQRVIDGLNKGNSAPLEVKDQQGIYQLAIQRYISLHVGERVSLVMETTKDMIKQQIAVGQQNGESYVQIAKRVLQSVGGKIAAQRAFTIARTETHAAAMTAQDEAAKSTGAEFVREWLAVEDGRTRPDHAGADGQLRRMEEKFDVGGSKLSRPGDPAGPASQTINCRCVLGYRNPEEFMGDEE